MALKEFKSITVEPGTEDSEIRLWQTFGWDLVGAPQEVRTSDSQIKTGADDNYDYYKTIAGVHYIKLSFERNPERKNYEELKSLESQYYELDDPCCPLQPKFMPFLWLILVVGGLFLCFIPGIIFFVLRIVSYRKQIKKWNEDYSKYQQDLSAIKAQRDEILAKAEVLV